MNDEGLTLTGWAAVPAFLMLAVTPMLTALVVSIPVCWLVNEIFSHTAIHSVFGIEHLNYWRVVGLFIIFFMTKFKVKFSGRAK